MLNGADFGVQIRRRMYWTTFEVNDIIKCTQTWDDVLLPLDYPFQDVSQVHILNTGNKMSSNKLTTYYYMEYINGLWKFNKKENVEYVSKWQKRYHSDTGRTIKEYTYNHGKSVPMTRNLNIHTMLIDRRYSNDEQIFKTRYFEGVEVERLFYIPDGWVSDLCSKSRTMKLLGNTVIVKVIEYVLRHILLSS